MLIETHVTPAGAPAAASSEIEGEQGSAASSPATGLGRSPSTASNVAHFSSQAAHNPARPPDDIVSPTASSHCAIGNLPSSMPLGANPPPPPPPKSPPPLLPSLHPCCFLYCSLYCSFSLCALEDIVRPAASSQCTSRNLPSSMPLGARPPPPPPPPAGRPGRASPSSLLLPPSLSIAPSSCGFRMTLYDLPRAPIVPFQIPPLPCQWEQRPLSPSPSLPPLLSLPPFLPIALPSLLGCSNLCERKQLQ